MKNKNNPTDHGKSYLLIETVLSLLAIAAVSFLPTFHLFVSNAGVLKLGSLMSSVYLFVLIGAVLYIVLRILLRKRPFMAGCLATLITFLLVNFSLLSDPLKLIIYDYAIANILAILVMILLIVGAWFLLRRLCADPQVGKGILTVFTIVFMGLIAFNGSQLLFSRPTAKTQVQAQEAETPVEETPAPTSSPQPTTAPTVYLTLDYKEDTSALDGIEATPVPTHTPKPTATPEPTPTLEPTPTPFELGQPNIYLMVYDEFASMGAMEKYYDYNCDAMRDFMRSVGINWSEHSYSMTNETKFCMTDLNMMDFVSYGKSWGTLSSMRKKSAIQQVFEKKLGYELFHYSQSTTWFGYMTSLRNSKNRASYQKTTMDGVESENIVKNQSLLGAFENILGSLTPKTEVKTSDKSESLMKYGYYSKEEITSSSAFKKHTYHSDIQQVLDILSFFENEDNFKGSGKRAIFSYIKCPHAPFYFDQYGQVRAFNQRMNWNKPDFYRDQYIFITKHIFTIFKTIISADPHSIIIIMSDHGVRSHNQGFANITNKDNCWNFNAVYFCGQPLDIEGMSSVNVMRLIATSLGVDMPPVKDPVTVDSADDLSDVVYPR